MRIPLEDNISAFRNTMDTIIELDSKNVERWKGVDLNLSAWFEGRLDMATFVKECLEKYLKQNQE